MHYWLMISHHFSKSTDSPLARPWQQACCARSVWKRLERYSFVFLNGQKYSQILTTDIFLTVYPSGLIWLSFMGSKNDIFSTFVFVLFCGMIYRGEWQRVYENTGVVFWFPSYEARGKSTKVTLEFFLQKLIWANKKSKHQRSALLFCVLGIHW